MTTPIDLFLESKKTAAPLSGMIGRFGRGAATTLDPHNLGAIGGQAAIVGALGGLTAGAAKLYSAVTKSSDFNNMLHHNPHLREKLDAEPERFNQYFNSLRALKPEYTRDPVLAGHFINNMFEVDAGSVLMNAVKEQQPPRPIAPIIPEMGHIGKTLGGIQQNQSQSRDDYRRQ